LKIIFTAFENLRSSTFQIAEIVLGILSITVAIAANVIVSNGVASIFVVVTYTSAGIWCGLLVSSCNCLRSCL